MTIPAEQLDQWERLASEWPPQPTILALIPEARHAAELEIENARLVAVLEHCRDWPGHPAMTPQERAGNALAALTAERDELRAELAATSDDETPIDEAWLLSSGGSVVEDGVIMFSGSGDLPRYSVKFWQGRLCEWWYAALFRESHSESASIGLPQFANRGQLLDLLSALSIERKEVTP